jgi:hypothetical protein
MPEWLNDYCGENHAAMFFQLEPIASLLAQLASLNVCIVVLDWEIKPLSIEQEQVALPYHLTLHKLHQEPLFVVDRLRHDSFIKKASWRHVISVAQAHFSLRSSEGLPRLHVHDVTSYLRRENFNFERHMLDGLALPQNVCRNLCTARDERCMPSEVVLGAITDYLEMLYQTIRDERIAQARQRRQAQHQARESQFSEELVIVKTVDVGCGPCKGKKEQVTRVPFAPLYQEAHRRGRRPQQDLGNAAARFASLTKALHSN